MPKTSADLAKNPHISILLVGDGGTHKTRFTGEVPDIYVLDYDNGMAINRDRTVAYDTYKDAPFGSRAVNKEEGIYPWGTAWREQIKRINQIGEAIDKNDECKFTDLGFKGKEWDRPIKALGLDSLTTMSNICMNYVMKEDSKTGNDNPAIQNWGAQIRLMETVMDQLTSWPLIKVVTAHIQRNTNNITEVVEQLPLVTGKLAGRLGIYFDEVYYTQVTGKGDQMKFTLQTESGGMVKQAKSRYGVPDKTDTTWEAVSDYLVPA